MTDQEYQGSEEKQRAPQDIVQPTKSLDKSRRSFAKSGLVASGVLLTLSSRPVLGQSVCKSPSGFESGNLSFHGTPITCSGRTPGYWGANSNTTGIIGKQSWPSPYLADTTKTSTTTTTTSTAPGSTKKGAASSTTTITIHGTMFKDIFRCSSFGKGLAGLSLSEVLLQGGTGDPYQLGAHSIAALLNARSGLTPVLTEAQVINIFNEYDSKGYFEPTAGIKWNPADIVNYLKTTMPL
jgi:hypothetical protein